MVATILPLMTVAFAKVGAISTARRLFMRKVFGISRDEKEGRISSVDSRSQ